LYILIVEDEEPLRLALEKALTRHGHKVSWASTGETALEKLRTEYKELDLVLLDMNLGPGKSGWDVARIKMSLPLYQHIPMFIVSGLSTDEIHKHGQTSVLSGVAMVFQKPLALDSLYKAIEHLEGLKSLAEKQDPREPDTK
jgi:DNA-binding response OmpR family regulator